MRESTQITIIITRKKEKKEMEKKLLVFGVTKRGLILSTGWLYYVFMGIIGQSHD